MKVGKTLVLAASLLATAACFHQVIQTGRAPGPTVVERPWTATWIWGIVPATPINVSQECKSGVAVVETQMSEVNGLVYFITFGIYAPRDVKITCASGTALKPGTQEFNVAVATSPEARTRILESAIAASARSGAPVVVRF
jgi:hypothetical protein